jgi:hypothetical protein
MMRPESFRRCFITTHNIPYLVPDGDGREQPHTGGVLAKGQLVWAGEFERRRKRSVPAYAEDLGIVSVDPKWLAPAERIKKITADREHLPKTA